MRTINLTILRETLQGIINSISFALAVVNLEVVSRELLSPSGVLGAQALCIHESYKDFVLRALQVVPSNKSPDDGL